MAPMGLLFVLSAFCFDRDFRLHLFVEKNTRYKIFCILAYFLSGLFTIGSLGAIAVVLIHLVTYSLLSEFRKDFD